MKNGLHETIVLWDYFVSSCHFACIKSGIRIITVWRPWNSFVPVSNQFTPSFKEVEARAFDLYLAWFTQKGKENFDALPLKHEHLIL